MSDSICFEPTGTTSKTRRHIKGCLKKRLTDTFGCGDKVDDFLKIQGLDDSRFDYVGSVANIIYSKINGANIQDDSIDHNANKSSDAVVAVQNEADNVNHKLVGYDFLYRQLKENEGKKEANRIMSEIYDYTLAVNDSTKLLLNYCLNLASTRFVMEGRPMTTPTVTPTKHMLSYINALIGTMQMLSNSALAGAIACGDLFICISRVLMSENKSIDEVRHDYTLRKEITNIFQTLIYSLNDETRSSAESAFSNLSMFDRYKLKGALQDMMWFFQEVEVKAYWIMDFTSYEEYIIEYIQEIQSIYMDIVDIGDPVTGMQFTFPVNTVNIAKTDDGDVYDEKFLNDFIKRPVNRYNILVSKGLKLCSCCRLSSDVELLEQAGNMNSFGGGAVGTLGSHRVVVLNLNRMAIMADSEEDFYKRSEQLIKDAGCILRAHKDMLYKLEKVGLQPAITNGYIELNRMFSTFGLIGTWETVNTLNDKFGFKEDRDIDLAKFINTTTLKSGEEQKLLINQQQIPAESMAIRLAVADRLLFGDKYVPEIYSNQAIPLTEDVDVFERMTRWGRIDKYLTGGGIVHITVTERISPKQALALIKYSIKAGAEHFAINLIYSHCENGHIVEGKKDTCPVCGGKVDDYALRIVGYLRWTKSWGKERQKEFLERKINKISNFLEK